MDRVKIAAELVKLAKEVVADGPRDMLADFDRAMKLFWKQIKPVVAKELKGTALVKSVDEQLAVASRAPELKASIALEKKLAKIVKGLEKRVAKDSLSPKSRAKAVAKMNDTYHDAAPYNRDGWRDMVMCQEVGHTFGLGHQDENFSNGNLGTCMDYTSDPDGPPANRAPNL